MDDEIWTEWRKAQRRRVVLRMTPIILAFGATYWLVALAMYWQASR